MTRIHPATLVLVGVVACGGDTATAPQPTSSTLAPTYWADMAPLFAEHCTKCHRDGGIAPFRLDDYTMAKSFSEIIAQVTRARTMPPWAVRSDGSCGEFADSEALSDDEIARIADWAEAGAPEGAPQTVESEPVPTLDDAVELASPEFTPEIQGGELAEHDEYRCFPLDAPESANPFITGYEVVPGTPEIVHHVIVMFVDPDAAAEAPALGRSNLEQMQALDAESPERVGWPCFGGAGDGVSVTAQPVTWAPGQGIVQYPGDSGVPLLPSYKVIMQVHYNLADPRNLGKSDQTRVRFRTAPTMDNVGLFILLDPWLDSRLEADPVTLPPGQKSTLYSWTQTVKELGLDALPELQLRGIMPHMHELGHQYHFQVDAQCEADVQSWDFHWQRMYFYAEPIPLGADSSFSVTCDYDTRPVTHPVLPGWGTQNEMCLATLYLTVPLRVLQELSRM